MRNAFLKMEIDQWLFKKIWKTVGKLKPTSKNINEEYTVHLEEYKNKLMILARALTGAAIEILPAENYSAWRNNNFLLPATYSRFNNQEDNYFFYQFRIVYLSIQLQHQFNWQTPAPHTLQESIEKSIETSNTILQQIEKEYPEMHQRFLSLFTNIISKNAEENFILQAEWFGKWMYSEPLNQDDIKDKQVNQWEKIEEKQNDKVEIAATTKEEIEVLEVNKEKQEEYNLTHNFEKIDTIDEFNGNWRDFDDDEDLNENLEAIEELQLHQMVRVDSPSHSIYNAAFFNSKGIAEAKETEHNRISKKTDEWDFQKKKYKKNYCTIYEETATETNEKYIAQTLETYKYVLVRLEKKLNNFYNKFIVVKKQKEGKELDLEAMVDRFCDIKNKKTPSENVFLSQRKRVKDIAILILTDTSLSTDGYVENRRILDIEKQSLILFGELLDKYQIDFEIATFSSKTRNNCNYTIYKSFNETWKASRSKIGAIQPTAYTRIGPAIRNAQEHLQKHTAKNKWLLLLTDGKPNDYDKYEGKYGIEDVKQAIRELNHKHIHVSALAIDANAKYYLPQMLGKGNFNIIQHPNHLPEALVDFYLKLM